MTGWSSQEHDISDRNNKMRQKMTRNENSRGKSADIITALLNRVLVLLCAVRMLLCTVRMLLCNVHVLLCAVHVLSLSGADPSHPTFRSTRCNSSLTSELSVHTSSVIMIRLLYSTTLRNKIRDYSWSFINPWDNFVISSGLSIINSDQINLN